MNCRHLKVITEGVSMKGVCLIDNDLCPLVRHCPKLNTIVSADIYKKHGCVKESSFVG